MKIGIGAALIIWTFLAVTTFHDWLSGHDAHVYASGINEGIRMMQQTAKCIDFGDGCVSLRVKSPSGEAGGKQ